MLAKNLQGFQTERSEIRVSEAAAWVGGTHGLVHKTTTLKLCSDRSPMAPVGLLMSDVSRGYLTRVF